MTTEWTDLPTLQDVAKAQADGMEIERSCITANGDDAWCEWEGRYWGDTGRYRARPRQPKMKKVKMLCWLAVQQLVWSIEDRSVPPNWIRIPAQDIEVEIPEGV